MEQPTKGSTQISYTKVFLSGTLTGLTARCGYSVPDADVAAHMAALNAFKPLTPGSDVGTGAKFWVSNLGCTDYEEGMRDRAAAARTKPISEQERKDGCHLCRKAVETQHTPARDREGRLVHDYCLRIGR